MQTIYEMDNNGFSGVKWSKVTSMEKKWFRKRKVTKGVQAQTAKLTEGLCFGYSVTWVRKMLEGLPLDETVPTQLQAGLLQQKVEMWQRSGGWDNAINRTCKDLGLVVVRKVSPLWSDTAREMTKWSGFFIVDIGIHWVAMGHKNHKYYYFDANEGFFVYDNRIEFRTDVNSPDNFGYYHNDKWMTNSGEVCNCYQLGLA
ncbi:MAG TPA: hypothetical protein VF286_05025 [Acidiphilium sp.]